MLMKILNWLKRKLAKTQPTSNFLYVDRIIKENFKDGFDLLKITPDPYYDAKLNKRILFQHIVKYDDASYRVTGITCNEYFQTPLEVLNTPDVTHFKLFTFAFAIKGKDPKSSLILVRNKDNIVSAFVLPEGLENIGISIRPVNPIFHNQA